MYTHTHKYMYMCMLYMCSLTQQKRANVLMRARVFMFADVACNWASGPGPRPAAWPNRVRRAPSLVFNFPRTIRCGRRRRGRATCAPRCAHAVTMRARRQRECGLCVCVMKILPVCCWHRLPFFVLFCWCVVLMSIQRSHHTQRPWGVLGRQCLQRCPRCLCLVLGMQFTPDDRTTVA